MRRKVAAKKGTQENVTTDLQQHKLMKQRERPSNAPTGKGLGKAGAKRLGRLLKRAIQDEAGTAELGAATMPKTPVRLFKHQIQTKTDKSANMSKAATPQVSQLILSVVSQCKHRGGISMAELKQTLAAGGYDVTKNNRQVNVVTQRLVNNETLVQNTRNSSFKLNKTQTATRQVRKITVQPQKPKGVLKKNTAAKKSSKEPQKQQKGVKATPKSKGQTLKPTGRTRKPTGRTLKPTGRTLKPTGRTRKPTGRTRKPTGRTRKPTGRTRKTAAKSKNERKKTSKNKRKAPKPAGKKQRPAKKKVTHTQRVQKKTKRTQPKQTRQPYKYTPKRSTRRYARRK